MDPTLAGPFSQAYYGIAASIDDDCPQLDLKSDMATLPRGQLPQLTVQTRWPTRPRQHSVASGSTSWDASGSEFGLHEPVSWVNTPDPRSESPNLGTAGSGFTAVPESTFSLSRPGDMGFGMGRPTELMIDDLDMAGDFTNPDHGHETLMVRARSHLDFGLVNRQAPGAGSMSGHSRNSSAASMPNAIAVTRPRGHTMSSSGDYDPADNDGSAAGNDRKRRKRKRSTDGPRFACPYQAFYSDLDCFRSCRRNLPGGGETINRLRQHFKRRHRRDYRCRQCFRTFENAEVAARHPQDSRCVARSCPDDEGEQFMTEAQAIEVDKPIGSRTEEEYWWDVFRTLFPQFQGKDINWLRARYSPYYASSSNRISLALSQPVDLTGVIPQPTDMIQSEQYGHPDQSGLGQLPMMDTTYMSLLGSGWGHSMSQGAVVAGTPRAGAPNSAFHTEGVDDFRQGSDGLQQSYGTAHQQQSTGQLGEDARPHIARIQEIVSQAMDAQGLPPAVHGQLMEIYNTIPLLLQSIR